jgi:ligand-binding SRPBCC domain-containing protein
MRIVFEQLVPVSPERLFAFHRRPENLVLLQRGWPWFRMISHEPFVRLDGALHVAERFGPIWLEVALVHSRYEPPRCFADRQVRGPFASFEHLHEFLPDAGGTLLRDTLEFHLPWSLGGPLADRWIAASRFRRWFAYRRRELEALKAEGVLDRAGT